jgi:hypothetical protein
MERPYMLDGIYITDTLIKCAPPPLYTHVLQTTKDEIEIKIHTVKEFTCISDEKYKAWFRINDKGKIEFHTLKESKNTFDTTDKEYLKFIHNVLGIVLKELGEVK